MKATVNQQATAVAQAASRETETKKKDRVTDSLGATGVKSFPARQAPPAPNNNNTLQLKSELDEEKPLQAKSYGSAIQLKSTKEEEEIVQPKKSGNTVQLKTEEEEDPIQTKKAASSTLQLKKAEEEDPIQTKKAVSGTLQLKKAEEEDPIQAKKATNNSTIGKFSPAANNNILADMGSAMGADFTNIQLKPNSSAATALGAQAFARGNEIHFAPGKYKPDTQEGKSLLGHELTHVIQQRQGRVKPTIQAKGLPINDDQHLEKEADIKGAKAAAKVSQQGKTAQLKKFNGSQFSGTSTATVQMAGSNWNPMNWKSNIGEWNERRKAKNQEEAQKHNPQSSVDEHGLRLPTKGKVGAEVAKPTGVLGATAGIIGGTSTHGGTAAASAAIGTSFLGAVLTADSAMAWRGGSKRIESAKKSGDHAGIKVGERRRNQGRMGVAGGLVSTAQSGLNTAAGVKYGSEALMTASNFVSGAKHTSTVLGVAGGALGVAGGALNVASGAWKIGKAGTKLRALSGKQMLSEKGEAWKKVVAGKQKTKIGLNALKIAAGALGIAAGALIIASNPVGWAIGIAAAVAGAGMAAYKIGSKVKSAYKKRQAKKKITEKEPELRIDKTKRRMSDEDKEQEKEKVLKLANRVAQETSTKAKTASEMIEALQKGKAENAQAAITYYKDDVKKIRAKADPHFSQYTTEDLEAHDSTSVLGTLNVKPEEAKSPSGQELIEKKLSGADSI